MSMAPFRLSDPIQACPWKWRVTQRRPCLSIHLPCRTSCHVPPHFNFDIIEPRHHSATKDCGYLVLIRLQIPVDVGYTRQNVRPVMYIILDPFRCAKSSEKQETLLIPTANLNRDNSHRTSRYRGFSRITFLAPGSAVPVKSRTSSLDGTKKRPALHRQSDWSTEVCMETSC